MKKIYNLLALVGLIIFLSAGCTKNFETINTDPNRPNIVPTVNLIPTIEKRLLDLTRDIWFSGRQTLLYSQYWSQRNYTSEDRYALRDGSNNSNWNNVFIYLNNCEEIIKLNTDVTTKLMQSKYGNNANQIAAATALKSWGIQLMTDLYGDIPYSEAFNAATIATPKYDSQKDIYKDLLIKLKAASEMIVEGDTAFVSGDIIYSGYAPLWKKFINSMRLRIALRLSKITDAEMVALRNSTYTEAIAAGVFTSNNDNAFVQYIGDGESNAPMYEGTFTAKRNDFTVTKTLVDLLKGVSDIKNSKVNPFAGIVDPRMYIWVPKSANGGYNGMPYGMTDAETGAIWSTGPKPVPSLTGAKNIVLNANAQVFYMDYAEVCFMLSEINGWDQAWYTKGIKASMERWGVASADIDSYLAFVPAASAENVLTQKYIAHYMDGAEAWADWRRTGFPKNLVQPGEFTGPKKDGSYTIFTPIIGNAIPRRVTYPVQEYTINNANVSAAATHMGGNELSTKVWWDGGK